MSTVPFNQAPTDPSLKDVLDKLQQTILLSFNAHHIGTVKSFDPTFQKATATVNYKKTYYRLDDATGLYAPVLVDYPILADCPVICLGGGPTALTFPIAPGDECLVLFNDRDLDNWFSGSSGGPVATPRLHSFSDGIILVGLRSMAKVLTGYDTTRATLNYGTTLVGVGPTQVKIANALFTLNTLLQELITEIETLSTATAAITVICSTPGNSSSIPANAAAFAAVTAQLVATAVKIGQLLE